MIIDTAIRMFDNINFQEFRLDRQIDYNYVGVPICPKNILLPFQFEALPTTPFTTTFELYNTSDVLIQTLTIDASDYYRRLDTSRDIFIFQYFGNIALGSFMELGLHYLKYSDSASQEFFSDLFRVCDFEETISNNLLIDASNKVLIDASDKVLI